MPFRTSDTDIANLLSAATDHELPYIIPLALLAFVRFGVSVYLIFQAHAVLQPKYVRGGSAMAEASGGPGDPIGLSIVRIRKRRSISGGFVTAQETQFIECAESTVGLFSGFLVF